MRFALIHLILAIVDHLDFELYQMDVQIAFLNGELDEEIYMDQPMSFKAKGSKKERSQGLQALPFYLWLEVIIYAVVFGISLSHYFQLVYDGQGRSLCVC